MDKLFMWLASVPVYWIYRGLALFLLAFWGSVAVIALAVAKVGG